MQETLPLFTTDMALVLGLVALTVFLFTTEWLRVDVTAILVMVCLPLLGISDGRTAFQGLSSNAVISILAVIIMSRGLDHTGITTRIMRPLMTLAGRSRSRILVLLAGTVALISSFMQNTGAAALFLPAMRRLSRQSGIPLSQLLMPVGFCAILGGTITLVGTSPLIMLNDIIKPFGIEPFGLFSVTPVGLVLVAAGILYFMLAGRHVLPRVAPGAARPPQDPTTFYPELGQLYEIQAPHKLGTTFMIMDLCQGFGLHTVALKGPAHGLTAPPDRVMHVRAGDVLAAYGPEDKVRLLCETHGFTARPGPGSFSEILSDDNVGVVEALIPPHSKFVGMTYGDIRFRHNYLMTPLAIIRGNDVHHEGFLDMVAHAGDTVLIHGAWESYHKMRPGRNLIFAQSLDHEVLHPELATRAVLCFALSMALVLITNLPLSVCLMAGTVGMLLTRVLSVDEAYRSVDWRTIFLLGGLIPLGGAMQSTGAAAWLAGHLMQVLGTPPPVVLLFILALLSCLFTLVVSNVGTVALLVPLAVGMATHIGLDPRTAALVVALGASNSFMLPTHQVNALYMGPGGYSSRDFLRAGIPLSLLYLVLLTAMAALFY
ncbi:SLC13 family permease [Desulfocurvus sp. DL9XJH121]